MYQGALNDAFIEAAKSGDMSVLQECLEQGVEVDLRNDAALREAAEAGHLDIVVYLVEKGADIHAEDDWAFRRAAGQGHLEILHYLDAQGANPHAEDTGALWRAAMNGHMQVVRYLVEDKHVDVQAGDNAALFCAATSNFSNVALYLTAQGAQYENVPEHAQEMCREIKERYDAELAQKEEQERVQKQINRRDKQTALRRFVPRKPK